MSTPFLYPNGERIEVFLELKKSHLFKDYALSDYGRTALYLHGAQMKLELPAKKQELFDNVLRQFGVRFSSGDLLVEIPEAESANISDAILRLSQACLRISDFATHQRLRGENPFKHDVEDFLHSAGLTYIADVKVDGRFKNAVPVDFEVFGRERKSYVCVLSSATSAAASTSAKEIFRKWYDIADPEHATHEMVTVYNSASAQMKEADKQRLRPYSKLVAYPSEADFLKGTLAI